MYRITWEIDSEAETPMEALIEAWGAMRSKDTTATVFNIEDKTKGFSGLKDTLEIVYHCECQGKCGSIVMKRPDQDGLFFWQIGMDRPELINFIDRHGINGCWSLLPEGYQIVREYLEEDHAE